MHHSLGKVKKTIDQIPYIWINKSKNELGPACHHRKLKKIKKHRNWVNEIITRCNTEAERSFKNQKSYLIAEEIKENYITQGMEKWSSKEFFKDYF